MDERQDIYSGHGIAWGWVLVGVLVVLGSQTLLGAVLTALRIDMASVGVFALVTTVAFVVGGAVIGFLSPGYTAWEAGFASVVAAVGIVLLATRLLTFAGGLVALVPIAVGWGLLCGLAGGWIGERLQSSTRRS